MTTKVNLVCNTCKFSGGVRREASDNPVTNYCYTCGGVRLFVQEIIVPEPYRITRNICVAVMMFTLGVIVAMAFGCEG